MFAIRIKVEMETIGINLNIICCNADYMRALNRYNDQLCGLFIFKFNFSLENILQF